MKILSVITPHKSKINSIQEVWTHWDCNVDIMELKSVYQRMFIIWIQSLMGTIDSAPATVPVMTEKSMSETAGN